MNLKTKIFSLVLAVAVVVPMLFSQSERGNVLGVVDDRTATGQVGDGNNNYTNSGEIAGGVVEDKIAENYTLDKVEFKGLAKLNSEQAVEIATSHFSLGSDVKVVSGQEELNLVVGKSDVKLSEGVVATLNLEAFKNLGGDPENEDFIEITLYK